ncbi:MAG: citrate synthase [Oscillospiraceae bacterium]|nr:citrate synthase [Oscillospiraceae bacterium]
MDANQEILHEYLESLCAGVPAEYRIPARYYRGDAIKRGLRNADGTGVMAGVTRVGSVQGYYLRDYDKIPIPGELYYRGINVNDIVDWHSSHGTFGYEEVAYLLLFGRLPDKDSFDRFYALLSDAQRPPKGFFENVILKAPSRNVMNALQRCVLAMYTYDEWPDDTSVENVVRQSIKIIGGLPSIAADIYAVKRHIFDGRSLYIHHPDTSLSAAENFLRMFRKDKKFTREEALLLDLMLILHAEHGGGNNSTFTCRTMTSTGTDTYSAIAGAIGSLKGPLHGGANAKVLEMLGYADEAIPEKITDGDVRDFVVKLLNKEAGDRSGKVYGLGHAVYSISDPRAVAIRKYARGLAEKEGYTRQFDLLEAIERVGIPLLMERSDRELPMCANVDLYSGLVYQVLGIPADLFTPLFALARTAGWCAHRLEELLCGGRIIRPAYRSSMQYSGYVPMEERGRSAQDAEG